MPTGPLNRACGRGTVAVSGGAVAGDGRDRAIRRDPSDGVVAGVGDVERPGAVQGKSGRRVEARRGPDAIRIAALPAGQRGHDAIGREAADALRVSRIGQVDGAVGADRDAERIGKARARRVAVAHAGDAVAGDRRDHRRPSRLERPWTRRRSPRPPPGARGHCRDRDERRDADRAPRIHGHEAPGPRVRIESSCRNGVSSRCE